MRFNGLDPMSPRAAPVQTQRVTSPSRAESAPYARDIISNGPEYDVPLHYLLPCAIRFVTGTQLGQERVDSISVCECSIADLWTLASKLVQCTMTALQPFHQPFLLADPTLPTPGESPYFLAEEMLKLL